MRVKVIGSSFLILLFVSCSIQDETDCAASTPSFEERDHVARAINEFGHKLMLKMMKENVGKNAVLSPTGIAGLLAMTLLGSVGSTYDELAKVLGFSQDILENKKNHEQFGALLEKLNDISNIESSKVEDESTTETNINETIEANSTEMIVEDLKSRTLYADAIVVDAKTRIRSIYRDYLHRVYRGDAITAHFENTDATRRLINDWVKNHTGSEIEEFLSEPLPIDTKVVLLSALYFSGQWARPFLPEFTRNMTFRGPSGGVFTDLMLNFGEFNFIYNTNYDVQMIAFPYNDTKTTMYVIKPFSKTTLPDLLEKLNYSIIEQLIQNMTEVDCVVRFPKMDLSSKLDLKGSLKALGINSVFTPGEANFALMMDADNKKDNDNDLLERIIDSSNESKTLRDVVNALPNPGVFVDSVLHDVKMKINEYGTVAVAASSATMRRTAVLFYVNSPFYMFIRNEKTKLITFDAAIFDPTKT